MNNIHLNVQNVNTTLFKRSLPSKEEKKKNGNKKNKLQATRMHHAFSALLSLVRHNFI